MVTEQEVRKTHDLVFERTDINPGLLHQELQAALGAHFCGISHDGKQVRVHVVEDAPEAVEKLAEPVIAAHNAAGESDIEKRDKEEKALLAVMKDQKPSEWKQADKDKLLELLLRRMT